MRTFVGIVVLLSLVPATAVATPQYRPPRVPTPPIVHLDGNAIAENRRLEVHCCSADCRMVLDFDVRAPGGGGFSYTRYGSDVVLVDGAARAEREHSTTTVPIDPERGIAHVHIEAARSVVRLGEAGAYLFVADALWARHMLFAPRSPRVTTGYYDTSAIGWEPIDGAVQGPFAVVANISDETSLWIDQQRIHGEVQLAEGRHIVLGDADGRPDDAWVRPGGPVLAMGAYLSGNPAPRFAMRVGYEFGVTDWMIVSGSIETDFQTDAAVSLLIEGATPNMLFFFIAGVLSVGGGIGAVLELSEQGARGALRLSGTVQAAPVGVQFTGDYFPADDEWEVSVMGRVSL